MIPIIQQDIETLLGKLGAWPSDLSSEAALALYAEISNLKADSLIIDIMPNAGKSMVVAAAGAVRSKCKLQGIVPPGPPTLDTLWLQRAIRLFGLRNIVEVLPVIQRTADFAIYHNDQNTSGLTLLNDGGILFGINFALVDNIAPVAGGNGWAMWRTDHMRGDSESIESHKLEQAGSTPASASNGNGAIEDAILLSDGSNEELEKID